MVDRERSGMGRDERNALARPFYFAAASFKRSFVVPGPTESTEYVWGAPAIAAAINKSVKATYHALETGRLPGACKVAGKWCFSPSKFAESFRSSPRSSGVTL